MSKATAKVLCIPAGFLGLVGTAIFALGLALILTAIKLYSLMEERGWL